MALLYKATNEELFQAKFLEDSLDHQENIITFESDDTFLMIGLPGHLNNIINMQNDVEDSINQIAKFCLTQDFLLGPQLFEPAFISSIIKLINTENSLAFSLIKLIRNMWKKTPENIEILFNDELISSFCKYLCIPNQIRDFVFEAFHFLLENSPQSIHQKILDILIEFHLFDSLDDFFQFISNTDFSQLNSSQRPHEMIERTINLIHSLAFNPFLNHHFYSNLMNYSFLVLLDFQNHKSVPYIVSTLNHIIKLGGGELLVSENKYIEILLGYHFFNDHQVFQDLYEIDALLWKYKSFKNYFLNDNHFMFNIATLLINQKFKDHLKPIFLFLSNVMPDIWQILFSLYINFGNNVPKRLIYIILDRLENDYSLNNKVYFGLVISSFLLEANMKEKKEIAFDGAFKALCLLISTAEDFVLKKMLKSILMLLSLFQELFKDITSINEMMQILENMDEGYGDDEIFFMRTQIVQLVHSTLDNT